MRRHILRFVVFGAMESAARQLQLKIKTAREFLTLIPLAGANVKFVHELELEVEALEIRFALATGHIYMMAAVSESQKTEASQEFLRVLAAEGFAEELDRVIRRGVRTLVDLGAQFHDVEWLLSRDDSSQGRLLAGGRQSRAKASHNKQAPRGNNVKAVADVQRLLNVYPHSRSRNGEPLQQGGEPADGAAPRVDYERCPVCAENMTVDSMHSELKCDNIECGVVKNLIGVAFDDGQYYNQEGQKAKSGTFNPNRHFLFWWTHILAREPPEEICDDASDPSGSKLLDSMRQIILRNRWILRLITVYDVRLMLREVDRTDLNKNIPLLMKKLTGIGPPQLSEAIAVRVENLFTKAIEIAEDVRRPERTNRNYYPYYIMKILDHILPADDIGSRRVLYYIYVQGAETVGADDEDWELICGQLKNRDGKQEIEYKQTNRDEMLKYYPV